MTIQSTTVPRRPYAPAPDPRRDPGRLCQPHTRSPLPVGTFTIDPNRQSTRPESPSLLLGASSPAPRRAWQVEPVHPRWSSRCLHSERSRGRVSAEPRRPPRQLDPGCSTDPSPSRQLSGDTRWVAVSGRAHLIADSAMRRAHDPPSGRADTRVITCEDDGTKTSGTVASWVCRIFPSRPDFDVVSAGLPPMSAARQSRGRSQRLAGSAE